MPKPPQYGLIYNWDGNPHGYSEYPQTMEQFLDKVYAPMEETQVGAHFWCVGEHTARWESDVLETVGDVYDRVYENAQSFTFNENIRGMIERGEDPQAGDHHARPRAWDGGVRFGADERQSLRRGAAVRPVDYAAQRT